MIIKLVTINILCNNKLNHFFLTCWSKINKCLIQTLNKTLNDSD